MANPNYDDFFYDVFLSFRGATRHGFTNDLYNALRQKGIYTFRDNNELRIGAEIRPALLKAIENSRMSMVVLCEDYASSTWCLDELAKIIDCYHANKGKQDLVIFYKVEPSDVWDQKNSYAKAMAKHEERFGKDSERVKKWREALSKVRDLTPEHCKDSGYEPGLIPKIVKDTSAKLPPIPLPTKHVVGIDSRFQEVKSMIDIESHGTVRILEIYGAGGIGKTTFALHIYNNIRHQFEAASFLANVREKSNKSTKGLEDLLKTLLSEMGEGTEIIGADEIKRRLGHKKVLLVLDDVDAVRQFESLTGGGAWFGSGSRIIITTRVTTLLDKHVTTNVIIEKYEMKVLNDRDSLELFCWQAFKKSGPEENFEDVSNRAVRYAKGLPLALKVIGSNLKGGSLDAWDMELDKYENIPNAKIQEVLEISYHSLNDLDQKIFLDITCFFKGETWEYVESILKASDFFPSIRVFIVKCLITVDENGCLDMHDLIQVMGREIVRRESSENVGDRTRLWCRKEVLRVLKENSGSNRIEGIMLDPPSHQEVYDWIDTAFEKMENLRILIIRNTTFSTAPSYLPNTLRLLDWKGYPSKSFPPHFYPHRIVDFKLPHSSLMLEKPFQVCEEKERIQFVMPKQDIPNWFDRDGKNDVPLMWARHKFPIIALAFVMGKSDVKSFASLRENCACPKPSVGEEHVLLCDLRVLFSDEEWQGLDAYFIGGEWKAVQVQCNSYLPLRRWGVFVYKQKTNTGDIRFSTPHPNSSRDYIPFPSSVLVEQRIRRFYANMNPREFWGSYLPFVDEPFAKEICKKFMFKSPRGTLANDAKGKDLACDYGASLMQDHEESTWDVVRLIETMKENTPKHILDSYPDDARHSYKVYEEFLRTQPEGSFVLDIPIILEDGEDSSRRYWGKLQIKHGEPAFYAVWRKGCRVSWRVPMSNNIALDAGKRVNIVLLKCWCPSKEGASTSGRGEEECHEYDPMLDELMSRIEEDAMSMRLNKSYDGKLKASIVSVPGHEFVSSKYLGKQNSLGGKKFWKKGTIHGQ
ncbi:TMV resistance protein N [Spatholobus suberectus]|nr:TMV resistance protein N [Spatholobus suberectus]